MTTNRPPPDAATAGPSETYANLSSWSRRSDRIPPDNSFASELRSSSRSAFSGESAMERSGSKSRTALAPVKRGGSEKLGSQREIRDDEARFVYVGDPRRTNEPVRFAHNSISTSKYTVLTFLPRNLFEQFHRVAYVYFLVLLVLNQIPQLGVFSPIASVLPLAFVLGVTAIKDGYEDWRRHRADRTENNRTAAVLMDGEFRPKPWKDVLVGDVIKLSANETLPCDMVLLSTSDPTGVAYVQTINLDGESNLKTRYAKQEILSARQDQSSFTGLLIRCEKPNRHIYGFLANVETGDGKKVSLGPSNVILRGCEVKNTAWVIGVAVYTGMETKVMQNSSGAPSKRSRLEDRMNREVIILAIVLFALCSIVTVLVGTWLGNHHDELNDLPYYRKEDYSDPKDTDTYNYYGVAGETVFSFLKAVILFQVMVPIALYISMELVRLGQAFFMTQDREMFDEGTNSRFQCRALNINEDLGQIKYVFSDKTGTLTENKMEFRCASVYGVDYSGRDIDVNGDYEGYTVTVDGKTWRPKTKVMTDPELMSAVRGGMGKEKLKRAHDFFLALATCNTIVPIVTDAPEQPGVKLIDFQGESPDEQALVYAAAAHGFVLLERTSGHITVDVLGDRQRYVFMRVPCTLNFFSSLLINSFA